MRNGSLCKMVRHLVSEKVKSFQSTRGGGYYISLDSFKALHGSMGKGQSPMDLTVVLYLQLLETLRQTVATRNVQQLWEVLF